MFNESCDFSPADFCGTSRLFPLPDVVLFPHVVQALQVFEPRYRDMLEEALATDQLIGMALLTPGWESEYDQRPAVESVFCIGQVLSHSKLADGRYNILVAGVHRAQLVKELPATRSFREVEAILIEDHYGESNTTQRSQLKEKLVEKLRHASPGGYIDEFLATEPPLGVLTDVSSSALPLSIPMKQHLLSEPDVDSRARILLRHFDEFESGELSFPPDFSLN